MSSNIELSEKVAKMCAGCFCRQKNGGCHWPWVDIQRQNDRADKDHCGDAIHDHSGKNVYGSMVFENGVWNFHPKPK